MGEPVEMKFCDERHKSTEQLVNGVNANMERTKELMDEKIKNINFKFGMILMGIAAVASELLYMIVKNGGR